MTKSLPPRSVILTLVLVLLAGCVFKSPETPTTRLTVSAASSLTEAFTEIGAAFETANPDVSVIFNFAGSQELAQQIVQGAAVDVFASANRKQMDVVLSKLQLAPSEASGFTQNRLVVVYPARNAAGLVGLADLTKPGVKIVLAGSEVPVGQYSLDYLALAEQSGEFPADYQDAVLANVVSYEQNVRAVLTKISLDEADAGIVYKTDIGSAKDKIGVLEIPDALNVIATYPILAIPTSQQAAAAQAFVEYVLSAEGQAVLVKYGFSPVD